MQRGNLLSMRYQTYGKTGLFNPCNSEAYTLYRNTSLSHDVLHQGSVALYPQPDGIIILLSPDYAASAVDMSRNDMSAKAGVQRKGTFQIHLRACLQL